MNLVSLLATAEYLDWYNAQSSKVRAQIDSRLQNLKLHHHFGHVRRLSSVLFELKFNNGNRIYFTEKIISGKTVILILGGNKNGQDKDIKRAQKISEKIHRG